ncbi:MAG: hypothetical protein H8F28_19540 [Fibrella sp.]|nr:hypothetical protein [Armatimonadota bacterium]
MPQSSVFPGSYIVLSGDTKRGLIRVRISLPDMRAGRYQGTRFAATPMIARVEWAGHVFFGEWNTGASEPLSHDANALGTAEEFDIDGPATFAPAPARGIFIKLGVGLLRRPDDGAAYQFHRRYDLVKPAHTRVRQGKRFVETLQFLSADLGGSDGRGYGYLYRYRIDLLSGKPAIRLTRTLTNTGLLRIETEHYNHNFLRIDDDSIGPGYRLRTAVPLVARDPTALKNAGVLWQGQGGTFLRPMAASNPAFAVFGGAGLTNPAATHFAVQNLRTGAEIAVIGSGREKGLNRFNLYATEKVICPEPFTRVTIPSGKTITWTDTYTFSA